jgi:endoglucanase
MTYPQFTARTRYACSRHSRIFVWPLLCLLLCALAACGGSGGVDSGPGDGGGNGGGGGGGTNNPPVGKGPFIVVDQFGYPSGAQKIAVIRDPQSGFDAADSYTPGTTFELVLAATDAVALSTAPQPWNGGATDASSGDRVWWFDFSGVTAAGDYFVRDADNGVVSPTFTIGDNVYADVLRAAVRMFFYQRAGIAKTQPYVPAGWTDGASHLGPGQDPQARRFLDQGNAATARDLRGGWYDAGDYNKYTNWTADYVLELLHAYLEQPAIWGDDFNIPESGNGIPDLLDEVKWGVDWLVRMQNSDGSVLSIVGLDDASPPSAATGPSYYGDASTSATLSTAAALAFASKVFATLGTPAMDAYADDLANRAQDAWAWAMANPDVTFFNNDATSGTRGLGAGQQEVNDQARSLKRVVAAIYLYALTGDGNFRDAVDAGYGQFNLIASDYADPFGEPQDRDLLYYAALPGATAGVASDIESTYVAALESDDYFGGVTKKLDPYMAQLRDYTWGSNHTKSAIGNHLLDPLRFGLGGHTAPDSENAALGYLHYLHGVNPLGLVYLSNMGDVGAEKSVDQFYHAWFANGSANWDSVSGSTYGPAPGFLVGGANPFYDWDACCPTGCGSAGNNALCGTAPLSPPAGQPKQKSYLQFNDSWPLDSWQVTENSDGYQVAYIRMLAHFVSP